MRTLTEEWYIELGRIRIAHEFIMTDATRSDYSGGRRVSGFSYALEGEAEYRLQTGERFSLKGGDVIFLPAGIAYTVIHARAYHHYTVNYEIREQNPADILPYNHPVVLHRGDTSHIETVFRELCHIWAEKKSGFEMQALGCLYRLTAVFVEEMRDRERVNVPYYRHLLPAKEVLDQSFSTPLTNAELAALCRMSETNFRRRFAEVFGKTPLAYRDERRLQHARELLASGYYTVGETACACGFSDVGYFVRFFRKHTGITPGEYMHG